MTDKLKRDLLTKYKNDLKRAKVKSIHDVKLAQKLEISVSNGIRSRERKMAPFKAGPKVEAIRLLRYNRHVHRFDDDMIEDYWSSIVDYDIQYIEECEWCNEFAQYLLGEQVNLAKCYIADQYYAFSTGIYERIGREVESLLMLHGQTAASDMVSGRRRRHFILHIGGTNSGKTFTAMERLKTAEKGVYAGPLRLLALEVYDKLMDAGIRCTMITGQEQYETEGSTVMAATVEMVDPYGGYDIAVIDEVQMVNDPYRGHIWFNLITQIRAEEVHLCMAPEVENIIVSLLSRTNEDYEIIRHYRNTDLVFEEKEYDMNTDIQRGDALILFSKREVLDVAARLEQEGISVSTIYGSLPPQTRKRQFELFLKGKTDVVVATDAIGLGVNLPIRRIIFMDVTKFDGKERRQLNEYEVRQIAGRAGRQGMYDQGYVTALSRSNIEWLKEQYYMDNQVEYVRIGFPKALLDIDGPLNIILEEWDRLQEETDEFRKIDIDEYLKKYKAIYPVRDKIECFGNNRELYELISCDVDSGNEECMKLWKKYCLCYNADTSLPFPKLENIWASTLLEKAEIFYKELDLYNQFSRRMGKNLDEVRLNRSRTDAEKLIMEELSRSKESYLRRCVRCGKVLPVDTWGKYCEDCDRQHIRRGRFV